MAERDLPTPIRVPADPEGRTARAVDVGWTYEERAVREPWFAPNRDNPRELIVKGEVVGEPVALYGVGDADHTVTITIYPDLGRDTNGETIEGAPIIVRFDPARRTRRRIDLPSVGLIVVEDVKGRLFVDGYSRLVTSRLFAEPVKVEGPGRLPGGTRGR